MDYFQGIVTEYLRANRQTFVNPEFFLQLIKGEKMPTKGTSWYVDALAVNFGEQTIYLCEVTYSKSLSALLNRLGEWSTHWPELLTSLQRDASIPAEWPVRPWVFIPKDLIEKFIKKLKLEVPALSVVPRAPRITPLEMTLPWRYCTYNREGEEPKACFGIPDYMQS